MAGQIIDIPAQFPNSMMANAVKRGQSRFIKADTLTTVTLTADETTTVPPATPAPVPQGS